MFLYNVSHSSRVGRVMIMAVGDFPSSAKVRSLVKSSMVEVEPDNRSVGTCHLTSTLCLRDATLTL